MMNETWQKWLVPGLIGVLVAIGSFWAGMAVQKSDPKPTVINGVRMVNQFGPARPGGFRQFGASAGSRTIGQVTSLNGTTMTVATFSGSNVTVSLAKNPVVSDPAADQLTVSDIKTGASVEVSGTVESSGTIDASQIRLVSKPSTNGA